MRSSARMVVLLSALELTGCATVVEADPARVVPREDRWIADETTVESGSEMDRCNAHLRRNDVGCVLSYGIEAHLDGGEVAEGWNKYRLTCGEQKWICGVLLVCRCGGS